MVAAVGPRSLVPGLEIAGSAGRQGIEENRLGGRPEGVPAVCALQISRNRRQAKNQEADQNEMQTMWDDRLSHINPITPF